MVDGTYIQMGRSGRGAIPWQWHRRRRFIIAKQVAQYVLVYAELPRLETAPLTGGVRLIRIVYTREAPSILSCNIINRHRETESHPKTWPNNLSNDTSKSLILNKRTRDIIPSRFASPRLALSSVGFLVRRVVPIHVRSSVANLFDLLKFTCVWTRVISLRNISHW